MQNFRGLGAPTPDPQDSPLPLRISGYAPGIAAYSKPNIKSKSNLHYIVLNRRSVLRVHGLHIQVIALGGNTCPFKEMSPQWRAVGNTLCD